MGRRKFNSESAESVKPIVEDGNAYKTSTKEKRQQKDKRNIIRAKRPAAQKLNKRLLHQQRAAALRAETPAQEDHRANRHLEEEEGLGTRWSVLQNLDSIDALDKKRSDKRARSKSNAANTRVPLPKKAKTAPVDSDVEIESEDEEGEPAADSEVESSSKESSSEEEDNGHVSGEDPDHEAIIDQLAKQQLSGAGKTQQWFEGVDPRLLDADLVPEEEAVEVDMDGVAAVVQEGERRHVQRVNLACQRSAVALDCEMVGVGEAGHDSCLARVSLVDRQGATLYDKYVRPPAKVTDFRTKWSGIRPQDLEGALPFAQVQREVAALLKNRLLVAHSVRNDLSVLMLSHPGHMVRDTATYDKFRKKSQGLTPSLRNLAREFLQTNIQDGEHDSVVDARTTMRLYALVADEWEAALQRRGHSGQRKFSKLNQKRTKRRSTAQKTGRGLNVKGKGRAKKVAKNKGYY